MIDDPVAGDGPSQAEGSETASSVDGLAAERERRLASVEALRSAGIEPYPSGYDRSEQVSDLVERYAALEAGIETSDEVSIMGRIVLMRRQGKLIFVTLRDGEATIQLFISKQVTGDEAFDRIATLDLGDWVGARGVVMTTRRGELSVKAEQVDLLSKSLRPPPDKWHGLADVDRRFREREVDLIANEASRITFRSRSKIVSAIRRSLEDEGFLEVETPILQMLPGGGSARPFMTHHNTLDVDLYLRIAPELYLKRLIVGGLDRVFEIGRNFRNEGLSVRHNPEFTMLEVYQAGADYLTMADLVERIVTAAAASIGVSGIVPAADPERPPVDLTTPWRRASMVELVQEATGIDVSLDTPLAELRAMCAEHGATTEDYWGAGRLFAELYEATVEHQLWNPTIVTDFPVEVSPLARRRHDDPRFTERFEVVVRGQEIANAFTELNDPIDQRERFEAQAALKALGDAEAPPVDEEYLRALEYGLPPTGGLGVGIDRLVMLLTGVSAIREVLLFPTMRPRA